jgi:hypothetical protein
MSKKVFYEVGHATAKSGIVQVTQDTVLPRGIVCLFEVKEYGHNMFSAYECFSDVAL